MSSFGPLVSIPPGYCFIPSCPQKPTATPSSNIPTLTTSTTTIIGPTITASLHHNSKRSNDVKPMLGTHSFAAFPTDAAIPIGDGPICIVFCEWAKMMNGEETMRPAIRPTSVEVVRSTMMIVSKATMTMDVSSTLTSSSKETLPSATPIMWTSTAVTRASIPTSMPSSSHHQHRLSAGGIAGITVAGVAGLALIFVVAWLITHKVRQVKAKLNKHTQGVHRDHEREVYELGGGKGIPEMGGVALAEVHGKV
ncbi:MAG: hypothetical protein Q9166_003822 [cf. Caloplaca sp. 2 TL-2023]